MPLKPIETKTGLLEYTVSSSFGYRFSRYLVLPRITDSEKFKSGQPFQLSPMIQAITSEYLTQEEQQATYSRPNGSPESVLMPFAGTSDTLERTSNLSNSLSVVAIGCLPESNR